MITAEVNRLNLGIETIITKLLLQISLAPYALPIPLIETGCTIDREKA
jgi:hypothetical protein